MPDFRDELSLLTFVLLNTAVFVSTWFFASRRFTRSRSQAILDAALLGYAVQYVSVGLPGLLHCLSLTTMVATATVFVVAFIATGWKRTTPVLSSTLRLRPEGRYSEEPGLTAVALFTLSIIILWAQTQASLPVLSNDAMTYHFPAAVQWLQDHRISLFQTWFFNPANTYSPLAGSIFIAWMIAPFDSDVLARFVQVPALICVGIAMHRLCRELGVRKNIAALIAGAALLSRPIFLPSMMGKDDLFVAFFFIAALVALSRERSGERCGPVRLGIALGLLLATKYTAMLSIPILLLAVDTPRWRLRGWTTAAAVALLLAGPWYLRNWILTGNPIFPMYSLFTTATSQAFSTWPGAMNVLLGGAYGMPSAPAILLAIGWIISFRWCRSNPICRTCVVGILPGLALFYLKSPFPEVRFVLPLFLLMFACAAIVIDRIFRSEILANAIGLGMFATSLLTLFASEYLPVIGGFAAVGVCVAAAGLLLIRWAKSNANRWSLTTSVLIGSGFVYAYINWHAYCRDYYQTVFDKEGAYAQRYPESIDLWRSANEQIPADAIVAYTNLYLIYPLQCDAMQRRLVYCPTRSGVKSIADLGWLGSHLSGEQLIPAAVHATAASADQATWITNLRNSGAKYVVIGKGGVIGIPPEAAFANGDPANFALIAQEHAGWIYLFSGGPEGRAPGPPGRR